MGRMNNVSSAMSGFIFFNKNIGFRYTKPSKMFPYISAGKNKISEGDYLKNRTPYEEQETVIVIPDSHVSKTADVYTCVPHMLKKLRKQAKSRPDCVQIKRDLGDALFADVDSSCIRITPKRLVSDEQRAAASERMKKAREKM